MKAQFCFIGVSLLSASIAMGQPGSPDKMRTGEGMKKLFSYEDMERMKQIPADVERAMQQLKMFDFAPKMGDWNMKPGMDMAFKPGMFGSGYAFAFQKGRGEDQGERQYERGKRSLDNKRWDEAVGQFEEAAAANKSIADGAMYWKAYALMKLGRGKEATAVLDDLAKGFPQSRWLNDAKAMRVEIAQAAGRPVSPESATDDDLKLMAINGLMQSDAERAIPLLEKILTSQSSHKLRERALFVLSQSSSPKGREVLTRIAKGGANPDLQVQAIRTLGLHGGKESRQLLADIYASSSDLAVKKQILNSFMVSGERERMLAIAKSDPNPALRSSAIHYLGTMGANTQLAAMYGSESSTELRAQIMQAMFVGGNSEKLIEIAKTEKDPALRLRAISHLGTMGSTKTGAALVELYTSNSDAEVRKKILTALFVQGNAKGIVEVARKETNADLRRSAVQHLSNMRSKDATDFLMEILNK
ncbi:MAG: HEAT repeat domain-containing protein [Acidobacteria bacterium]|nr:HEAT repeat domain-containing protein [Acidobacteriota bacterium]